MAADVWHLNCAVTFNLTLYDPHSKWVHKRLRNKPQLARRRACAKVMGHLKAIINIFQQIQDMQFLLIVTRLIPSLIFSYTQTNIWQTVFVLFLIYSAFKYMSSVNAFPGIQTCDLGLDLIMLYYLK